MPDLPTLRTALDSSFSSIEALGDDLGPHDWSTPSLCPGWTARDVVAHLAGIEALLAGWLPDDAETPPSFAKVGAFTEATDGLDDAAFLARVHALFDERRAQLAELTDADLDRPSWTPVGAATYGRFLAIRIFDFWVHERDITTPLGRPPADDTGVAAQIALAEVEGSLGYIVGKKVGLPDGKSLVFHLTGPLARDVAVAVDGRAKVVAQVDAPDVEVTTDTRTFVQLACGRIDPQAQIDAGRITWTGDDDLGDRAARNLRFTR
jgi:uncharacterized protein (TIGR03083 family)